MAQSLDASEIIDSLKSQANSILSSALGSTPLQSFNITSQGNFPYVWQDPSNLKFNSKTYDWISSNFAANTNPYAFAQGTDFTNQYLQAATNISWSLSSDDQAKLNDAAKKATQQQAAVLNAWQAAYGSLPDGNTPMDAISQKITQEWASPPTTLNDIKSSTNLNKTLNNVPASGEPIVPVFVSWLNALGSSVALQNQVTMNNGYLARAIDAIQDPTKVNGGMLLNNSGTTYKPAYDVATPVADIENAMADDSNKITLEMSVSRSTEKQFDVSVSGSTGFSIPIDFFTIGVGGSADYFSSNIATTDNKTTVSMSFPGVNLVSYGPPAFTQAGASENWYWMDPINEAVKNSYPAKDVSGFKWATDPTISDWSETGPFGYTMGAAIANYPTITIKVESEDYQRIQKTFEQSVSSSVSFLGIKLASASESTYSNNVQTDASSKTVTITMSPPKSLVAGTVADSIGWILGVQTAFPAA